MGNFDRIDNKNTTNTKSSFEKNSNSNNFEISSSNKKSMTKIVVITIILLILISTAAIVGTFILMNNNNKNNLNNEIAVSDEITVNSEVKDGENKNEAVIVVKANNLSSGIKEIILPNGKTENSSVVEYTVKENGNYTFKIITNDDKIKEEIVTVDKINAEDVKPYLPNGFKVIENDLKKGYVIEDNNKNQYVWIPVSSGYIVRDRQQDINFEEDTQTALEFVNSVSINKGFYVSRYEIAKTENDKLVSQEDKNPLVNVTYEEALNAGRNLAIDNNYTDVKSGLISSFAWTAILKQADLATNNTFSQSITNGNFSGTINKTGKTPQDKAYNIYDLSGNVKEWTTEKYNQAIAVKEKVKNEYGETVEKDKIEYIENRVLRGGSSVAIGTPNSITGYQLNVSDLTSGLRAVLYK